MGRHSGSSGMLSSWLVAFLAPLQEQSSGTTEQPVDAVVPARLLEARTPNFQIGAPVTLLCGEARSKRGSGFPVSAVVGRVDEIHLQALPALRRCGAPAVRLGRDVAGGASGDSV